MGSSSAKPMIALDEDTEEQKYILAKYNPEHSESCVPNSAQLQVKAVRASIKNIITDNPTLRPSVVYSAEVDKVRDNLGEGFRQEFDQLMPTQSTLNPSIYAWKRAVVPANPEEAHEIETDCPFFLRSSGENICKASIYVGGDPRRRLLLLTTEKVMRAGVQLSERGVMDATFDVSFLMSYFRVDQIIFTVLECPTAV